MIRTLALIGIGWFLSDVAPITEPHFWIIFLLIIIAIISNND